MRRKSNGKSSVTIFDVAKEAGVSYSTVSRVANGYQFVKPETRARVESAMERLGYMANLRARSLAGGQSQLIGLLIYDYEDTYNLEIVRGIDKEIARLDYDLMISATHLRERKESEHVRRLSQGMADGLLIVLPSNLDAYLADLRDQRLPFVLIDVTGNLPNDVNAVQAANSAGAMAAVNYLVELGHQRIGFIEGRMHTQSAKDRLAGYKKGLSAHGIDLDPALIVNGDFKRESGDAGMQKLLSLGNRPSAVFASNDLMAFGAIDAATSMGLRVPEDVSIVGFDDIPEAGYGRLTTVRQPLREMGREAAKILVDLINKPDHPPIQLELATELIVRETTAQIKTSA